MGTPENNVRQSYEKLLKTLFILNGAGITGIFAYGISKPCSDDVKGNLIIALVFFSLGLFLIVIEHVKNYIQEKNKSDKTKNFTECCLIGTSFLLFIIGVAFVVISTFQYLNDPKSINDIHTNTNSKCSCSKNAKKIEPKPQIKIEHEEKSIKNILIEIH